MPTARIKVEMSDPDELGDLIFALVNIGRHVKTDPENALRGTNTKFRRRFNHIETSLVSNGETLEAATLERMADGSAGAGGWVATTTGSMGPVTGVQAARMALARAALPSAAVARGHAGCGRAGAPATELSAAPPPPLGGAHSGQQSLALLAIRVLDAGQHRLEPRQLS